MPTNKHLTMPSFHNTPNNMFRWSRSCQPRLTVPHFETDMPRSTNMKNVSATPSVPQLWGHTPDELASQSGNAGRCRTGHAQLLQGGKLPCVQAMRSCRPVTQLLGSFQRGPDRLLSQLRPEVPCITQCTAYATCTVVWRLGNHVMLLPLLLCGVYINICQAGSLVAVWCV